MSRKVLNVALPGREYDIEIERRPISPDYWDVETKILLTL